MLGFVITGGPHSPDLLLKSTAETLERQGRHVVGTVQQNAPIPHSMHCEMDLQLLGLGHVIRITQDLGALSLGCRLNPQALEEAVGRVGAILDDRADVLVVNKFGKAESEGRGFRPLIGQALAADIPVLTSVNAAYLPKFLDFAGDLGTELPAQSDAVLTWLGRHMRPVPMMVL